MIVVDASLATKLAIAEVDSDLARRWFQSAADGIIAPDLIAIEVAQAIVRRVNMQDVKRDEGRQTLRDWRALLDGQGIELRRTDPERMQVAAEIAIQIGHPIKDCIYLALAMEFDCGLATSDVKFAVKARRLHPGIDLLADYGN